MVKKLAKQFRDRYHTEPILVHSPGRVNLIGEHTDYNEGFVLPGTIDKHIVLAVGARTDTCCSCFASDLHERFERDLTDETMPDAGWAKYLLGVYYQMRKEMPEIDGFNCVFGGNIPSGAGMASSAAIGAGFAFALNELFQLGLGKMKLAELSQRSENEYVGVRCGIMDQFANIFGRENTLIKLDCRSREFEYVPFEHEDIKVVLCDTTVRRTLAASEYNIRRQQCEAGVEQLQRHNPGVRSLRDATAAMLESHRHEFDPVIFDRCLYVVQENDRVLQATRSLQQSDVSTFGQLMFASHEALRDRYEVSCPELDFCVDSASKIGGVLGARMMGGGFGGCTINLVTGSHLDEFRKILQAGYLATFGRELQLYVSAIRGGTHTVMET